MKKLNTLLTFLIYGAILAFLADGIYTYWDYKTHPIQYAIQSAPWYVGLLVSGFFAGIVILLCIIGKLIIHFLSKKKK